MAAVALGMAVFAATPVSRAGFTISADADQVVVVSGDGSTLNIPAADDADTAGEMTAMDDSSWT
jgi:hypothetical protein